MITRLLYEKERSIYDSLVHHPLQTWAWGEFAEKQGKKVVRLGVFENEKMLSAYSVIFSPIPHTSYFAGYLPRGPQPDEEMLKSLRSVARDQKAIFIRLEPNSIHRRFSPDQVSFKEDTPLPNFPDLYPSSRHAFSPYTALIDLTQTEEELLAALHPKTRYNINLASRHGVKVVEETTDQGFKTYLDLTFNLTRRKGFYLHTRAYHELLWETLKPSGMLHLLQARYQNETLAAYLLFGLADTWYYPYGASSSAHKKVMASNLLMWEAILLGRRLGFKTFDMWGTLGPNSDPKNSWIGFHRFKMGYAGQLVQFTGTWDLVLKPSLYRLYSLVDSSRWHLLNLRKKLHLV